MNTLCETSTEVEQGPARRVLPNGTARAPRPIRYSDGVAAHGPAAGRLLGCGLKGLYADFNPALELGRIHDRNLVVYKIAIRSCTRWYRESETYSSNQTQKASSQPDSRRLVELGGVLDLSE